MNKQPTWARSRPTRAGDTSAKFRLTSLDRLHAAMTANGYLSGYQLAKASGVSVSTVNHLVHNRRRTASAETVRRIREALGRSADDLFVLEKSQVRVDHGHAA